MLPSGCRNPVAGPVGDASRRDPAAASDVETPMNRHLVPSHRNACALGSPAPSTVSFIAVAWSTAGRLKGALMRSRAGASRVDTHIWSLAAPPTFPPKRYAWEKSPAMVKRVRPAGARAGAPSTGPCFQAFEGAPAIAPAGRT